MAGILGVHVGGGRVGAVVIGDDGAMVPVPLGDDTILDPVGRAAAGEGEPLTTLVADVVGRATATTGDAPDRIAFVIPDELDGGQRDRVVGAAAVAGIVDVVAVPRSVADRTRPSAPAGSPDRPGELLLAAGAALTVRRMPPPIVTREDVDGPMPVAPVVPPPVESGPAVSVFDDETEEPPPVRRVEEAAVVAATAAAPPTTAMPAVGGRGGPGRPGEREFAHPPDRRVPVWVIVSFAVVLVAILAVVALLVLDGGDGETTTDGSSTTTGSPTSTDAPTSSTSSSTTSTSSSTTSTSSTTSSTTSTSSTTTVPQPVADPGPVTLVETGLQLDTGTVLGFGQNGETVLDELASVLGDPDDDRGWEATELCVGDLTRFVRWGHLEIVLEGDAADGDQGDDPVPADDGQFVEWYADGADDPVGLVTRDGLGVGATVGFLEVNYGSTLQIAPAFEGADEGVFAVANNATGGIIVGVSAGLDPDDTVTEMWAGDACQRTFL